MTAVPATGFGAAGSWNRSSHCSATGVMAGRPSELSRNTSHADAADGDGTVRSRKRRQHVFGEPPWPTGKIMAIEIDADFAAKARAAVVPWPQITISNADGA